MVDSITKILKLIRVEYREIMHLEVSVPSVTNGRNDRNLKEK